MALHTACIFTPKDRVGVAISVMSRHTQNDGKTPDERLDKNLHPEIYDDWRRELAPPPYLVGSWYKKRIGWEEFEEEYRSFLKYDLHARLSLERLAFEALSSDITIMCVESTPEKCHRRILAEECVKIRPNLVVVIK